MQACQRIHKAFFEAGSPRPSGVGACQWVCLKNDAMSKIGAALRLTRIEHSAMLAIAVVAAEQLAGGLPSLPTLVLSLTAPVLVSMAAFAINDYFDIEVDRLNRKERPLVTGELKPTHALYIAVAAFISGIAASAAINAYALSITLIFAALAVLYSYKLKEVLLLGNIYIALTMVIPFIFGAYVVGTTLGAAISLICVMIFASGLAREIHGTIRDYEGDVKVRNTASLPRAVGLGAAAYGAMLLYFAAIAISAYLFVSVAPFAGNIIFIAPILVSDALLAYVGIAYAYNTRGGAGAKGFFERSRSVSLAAMSLALLAILASAFLSLYI